MVNYARSAASAQRSIEAKGRSITFLKLNTEPADDTKPWRGPAMTAEPETDEGGASVSAIAVFVPARGSGFGIDALDLPEDPDMRRAEQFALVASPSLPANTNLRQFDHIRDGNDLWRIVFVGELRPASISIMWEIGVSK